MCVHVCVCVHMVERESECVCDTSTQKAFVDGISGCTEHHLKLLSMINEARQKHRSLCVAWLDLANAFGSVHHGLITFSLAHYHAPAAFSNMVSELYTGLLGIVRTKSWITSPIPLLQGVYQGDPLSVVIFNTVMNTLVDTITKNHPDLGYSLACAPRKTNLLQYADDTSLIADGPSSCRTLLDATDSWLDWSGMRANVPKCVTMAIRSSTGGTYNPKLSLSGRPIPFIGTSTFRFLGTPISIHSSVPKAKEALLTKLQSLLDKVDCSLVSRQQKLLLFKVGICPRLAWDLSTAQLSTTWLRTTLQPLATRYLKRWSGLARTADPNKLFLPKSNGGLDLPNLITLYRKLQVSKAATFVHSRDPTVRCIATTETLREQRQTKAPFKPFQTVVDAMKDDPGASKAATTMKAKARVQAADTASRLSHTSGLVVQGQTVRTFEGKEATTWSTVVLSLPERVFKFALNATTDTLPHNQNLCLWRKIPSSSCPLCGQVQSLLHVLNNCPVALQLRRYNRRHDDVLSSIFSFLSDHLPQGMSILADLPGSNYTFPPSVAVTDERPDIVMWDNSKVHLVELTVPHESGLEEASKRKTSKYADLAASCKQNGFSTILTTIQVGSRGFLHLPSLDKLYKLVKAPLNHKTDFERQLVRRAIEGSYTIWCSRNTAC